MTKLKVSFGQFKQHGYPFNSVLEDAIELFVVSKPPSHAKSGRPGQTLQTTPEFGEVEFGEPKIDLSFDAALEAKHRPCAVRMVVSPAWPEHAMCLTRGPIDTADIEPVEPERR